MHTFVTRDPAWLEIFRRRYARHSGHRSTLESLMREGQTVRVFVDDDGDLVGGFVCRFEGPLRYLSGLPPGVGLSADLDLDDVHEITHGWLDPRVRGWWRLGFLVAMYVDGLRTGRRTVLCGTTELRMSRRIQRGAPELVYRGPAWVDGVERPVWLFAGSPRQRLFGLLGLLAEAVLGRARPPVADVPS